MEADDSMSDQETIETNQEDEKKKDYHNKIKRNSALDELIEVYKKIKPGCTRNDVKKKINSLRTNFRKEFKKIVQSKRSGAGASDVYKPSSWVFYELQFLQEHEQPVKNREVPQESDEIVQAEPDDTNNQSNQYKEHDYSVSSINSVPFITEAKQRKKREVDKRNELLEKACSYLERNDNTQSSDANNDEELQLARAWASKLRKLEPLQKLYVEKAVHDVLFEAQLGNLNRFSVKINEHATLYSSKREEVETPSPSASLMMYSTSSPPPCTEVTTEPQSQIIDEHSVASSSFSSQYNSPDPFYISSPNPSSAQSQLPDQPYVTLPSTSAFINTEFPSRIILKQSSKKHYQSHSQTSDVSVNNNVRIPSVHHQEIDIQPILITKKAQQVHPNANDSSKITN
ncbi:hypothetical protein NQ314_018118, partial [Rhamnusium bicolor]